MRVYRSFSDRLPGTALIDALHAGYGLEAFKRDVLAGLTVGIVAIPLGMALAIAIGVPPQHGLYTSIVAGFLIALSGGSRFNISGPTAAFVVVLIPVVAEHGIGGLLLATMMAGLLLVLMGLTGLGRLVRFIPYPVVVGFTAGIAVVIATLQVRDLLGLASIEAGGHFMEQLHGIALALPTINPQDLAVGLLTLGILVVWPRLKIAIPAPLIALLVAGLGAWLAAHYWPGFEVATIATRFSYELDGLPGQGIPPGLPQFNLPWHLPGPDGTPLQLDFALLRELLGPALAIAMLGAIESLLCGVIADGMTGTRHRPNSELVGQGIGNVVAPLFGGITATAAIARTATSIRFGAASPVAGMVHAIVVLLAMLFMAGALSRLPMASLAALLLIVAWNMSEAGHFMRILKTAPRGDVAVLLTCFGLTVLFDMVVAVAVGIGLAAMLFIQRMADISSSHVLTGSEVGLPRDLPTDTAAFRLRGPMFFGAAERALATLHRLEPEVKTVILDMREVPSMDMSAIVVFQSMLEQLDKSEVGLIIINAEPRIVVKLKRAGIRRIRRRLAVCRDMPGALRLAESWRN